MKSRFRIFGRGIIGCAGVPEPVRQTRYAHFTGHHPYYKANHIIYHTHIKYDHILGLVRIMDAYPYFGIANTSVKDSKSICRYTMGICSYEWHLTEFFLTKRFLFKIRLLCLSVCRIQNYKHSFTLFLQRLYDHINKTSFRDYTQWLKSGNSWS
jgi:hypothetical protein